MVNGRGDEGETMTSGGGGGERERVELELAGWQRHGFFILERSRMTRQRICASAQR